MDKIANPLGYWCAPNGCGPDYAIEHDLDRFIAYGFWACHNNLFGPGTENMHPAQNDLYWLRRNFLLTVRGAAEWLEKCNPPKASIYHGDRSDSGISLPVDGYDSIDMSWVIIGYDADDAVSFELQTNLGYQLCVWLAAETLRDRHVLDAAIAKAEAVNVEEEPKPPEEEDYDDGKTPQQIVDEEYERHHP